MPGLSSIPVSPVDHASTGEAPLSARGPAGPPPGAGSSAHTVIPPSHDRPWRAEVAVLPRAVVEGDRVRLTGVRDFDYRSVDDFTVRYIEREVSLAHLTSVDLFISYWWPGPIAHTFVSFNFDNAPPVCISIEARLEEGRPSRRSRGCSSSSS